MMFRLGFLKSNGGDFPASNFGLLDQMAALEWIKNNIQAFGGNPNAVTVMGHGTGAACANFLMMAPPVSNNSKYDERNSYFSPSKNFKTMFYKINKYRFNNIST